MSTNKTIKGLAVALSLSAVCLAGSPSAWAAVTWDNVTKYGDWSLGGTVYELGSGETPLPGSNGIVDRYTYPGTGAYYDSGTIPLNDIYNLNILSFYDQRHNGGTPPANYVLTFAGTGAMIFGGGNEPLWSTSGIILGASMSYRNLTYQFNTDIYVGGNFNAANYSTVFFVNNSAPSQNNTLVFGTTADRKTIAGLQTNVSGTVGLQLYGPSGGVINDHLADGVGQGDPEAPLTGATTLALTMFSSATWTLTGSASYTGATQVMGGGRLVLDNTSLNAEKISNQLVLGGTMWTGNNWILGGGGASVELIGSAAAASAETLDTLTVLNGANQVIVTPGAGQTAVFNTGSVTRGSASTGGATVDFLVNGSGGSFTTTNADGDLGAWATLNGDDYASASSGSLVAATYTAAWGAGNNVSVSTDSVADGATAKNLKISAPATLTLTDNNTLSEGGILFAASAGADDAVITGGTLTAGGGEFIIQQHNTAAALDIESALSAAMLTKTGAGDLIVSGTSNASIVNINQGVLQLGADNVLLATGTINLTTAGATLDLNGHDLTTWSIQSLNMYSGKVALDYGMTAVVGNFAAGTEATLTVNRANDWTVQTDAFYGDLQTGDGAILNIVKTGAGVARLAFVQNGENNRGQYITGNSVSQVYNIIAGNVSVEQGTLTIGRDLYVYGGLDLAAGALLANCGAGQNANTLQAFTGLTGAGNLQSWARAGYIFNLDGSSEMEVWTGQITGGSPVVFNGAGTQYVGLQTNVGNNGLLAAGNAVVITPGFTVSLGMANDNIFFSPLNVAGQGVIKVTGTSGVVAGVAGVNAIIGLTLAGGTIWIAPEGSGENITVSGMTTTAASAISYGRAALLNAANITQLGGNSTLLLDRGANNSLDFQLGNAASTNAKFVRNQNGTLVLTAAHGLGEFGGAEKLTVFGSESALPVLTNDIMNTSIVTADGVTGAGSFLTTSTAGVTSGVVLKEAIYTTDLAAATGTSVVKHSGDIALADNTAVYALRNDGSIANDYTLTVGTGAAGSQAGLIMNNAAITGSGTITVGESELTVYVSGSNRLENKLNYANNNNFVGLTLFGDGLLQITSPQTLWQMVYLNSGVLELNGVAQANWESHSSFWLKGGVLQASGNFTRTFSSANNNSFMWYDGGFAAGSEAGLTVNVGGDGRTLTWQITSGFLSDYSVMKLGSQYAKGMVTLVNNIDLGASTSAAFTGEAQYTGRQDGSGGNLFRQIEVVDNPDSGADYAMISGVISSQMDYKGIQKSGDGLLLLTGENTYTGPTSIAEGVLGIVADSGLGAAPSAAAPITGHVNQGTVLINGGATLLAFGSVTLSANRNILLASGSDGSRGARIATAENGILTFGGQLGDSVGEQGSLLVNGALRLTGSSTISGFTEVEEGTLLVDGGLSTAHVVVDTGAKLGGSGLLTTSTGGISVSGILDATEALTLDLAADQKLEFLSGATLLVDANSALTFASEGDWLTGSGNATLELTGNFDYATQYTVLTNITTEDFSFATISGYDTANYEAQWGLSGNSYILTFDVIPEPSTWALIVTGVALLTILRHRR
ncbi:MAG: autotransporter-associated beta strand repeat-containing protein [Verrucomicrobiales bacterium]|jgi:fibronectin-binding autotransporter adhesin|nr:autotransporter-associated beta strand repeat-containing protein [Verrucomicrobiales bacterium]